MKIPLLEAFDGSGEGVRLLVRFFANAWFAILFLQSGLDKVFNYSANLDWIKGYFAKTFLAPTIVPMFATLTVMETASGALCTYAAVDTLFGDGKQSSTVALALCAVTFLMLFFGQRVAKDYPGAASLAPYFILNIFALYLLITG